MEIMPAANHHGATWLILGSGPGVQSFADPAFELAETVATTNRGIWECLHQGRWPEWYGVFEKDAPRLFGRYYSQARMIGGTRLVTSTHALANEIAVEADLELRTLGWPDAIPWYPGAYVCAGTSGGHLIQLAVNRGAELVILVGCEGYRSTKREQVPDTFDGAKGSATSEASMRWYTRALDQVIQGSPTVDFVFCGEIAHRLLDAPNVRRCAEPGDLAALVHHTRERARMTATA